MIGPNINPYVWKPFQMGNGQEPDLPITFYKWAPGQPDNYLSSEFCINLVNTSEFNDINCNFGVCTICEVDV